MNGETWSSINRRPRLPQKLYDIQHIKEELTKSTKEGIKIILEKDIYDIIAVQELVFSEKERAEIETVIEEIKDDLPTDDFDKGMSKIVNFPIDED